MLYQITAAMGPVECSIAVTKLYESLQKEYSSVMIIKSVASATAKLNGLESIYNTIFFTCDEEIKDLCGTIKWVCQSPVRPTHKRKNWFIKVTRVQELEEFDTSFSEKDLKFEPYKSASGPGGQHVNKTESGVILTHIPTGTKVMCSKERSQHMNRKIAIEKLKIELEMRSKRQQEKQTYDNWKEQCSVERGNEVRIYKGESFKRVK